MGVWACRYRVSIASAASALMLLLLPASASATTIAVNTTADAVSATDGQCSLREAVAAANSNTASGSVPGECPAGGPFVSDEIDLGAGTFSLTGGAIILNSDLSIVGQGDARTATTVIAGTGAGGGELLVLLGGTVTVRGLEFTGAHARDGGAGGGNGQSGGAIIATGGALTIVSCRFVGNSAGNGGDATSSIGGPGNDSFGGNGGRGGFGGAIYSVTPTTSLTVRDSLFASNHAGNGGNGGLAVAGGPATFGDTGHDARGGDGGAGGSGGAIASFVPTVISGTTFSDNVAGDGGAGGAGNGSAGDTGMPGGSGRGGLGGGGGSAGGLFVQASLAITSSTISGNRTGRGGDGGSALGVSGGSATASDGEQGGNGGGLLFAQLGNQGTATNVTFTANSTGAGGSGGAAAVTSGAGTVTSGSGARGGDGGAMWIGGAVLEMRHGTVVGDTVGSGGAAGGSGAVAGTPGRFAEVADLATTNLRVGGSIFPATGGCFQWTDLGYNLGGLDCPGRPGDPKLGPLQDNGGPTPTMKPAAGSPAIDQEPSTGAVCPGTDQRGAIRPVGSLCDLGAVEVAPPSATTGGATGVTANGANLGGTVDGHGLAITDHFEFGKTTAYGSSSPSAVETGSGQASVSATIAGLAPNTLYHYRLVATNPDGADTGGDQTFRTVPAQPPRVDKVTLTPSTFAVARAPTAVVAAHAKGTTIGYRLSESAATVLAIQRPIAGLRLTTAHNRVSACVAATARNKRILLAQIKRRLGKHASRRRIAAAVRKARCTAFATLGALRRRGAAGANRVAFSGRIGTRPLKPGRYRLAVTATDATGLTSPPASAGFRIVKS